MTEANRQGIPSGLGGQRKRRYDAYIDSSAWRERREAWVAEQQRRAPGPILCAICGQPWSMRRDDLHHVEYARLGVERHEDLVPLHRQAHDEVHDLLDRLKLRRGMPLRMANAHALAVLRRPVPCPQAATARSEASDQ